MLARAGFFEGMTTAGLILAIFALMAAMFALTATAIGINALIAGRDRRKAAAWLERQGSRVEKIEWTLFWARSLRLWILRYSSFEVLFVDEQGRRHKGIVAVPTWASPVLLEDTILP